MSSLSGWVALFGIAIVSVSTFPWNCANAQITSDGTLPTNSSIQKESNTFNIRGGTQSGGNLFHSFGEFSVPTGNTAIFNNAADIQNIISRVTGNSISNIDGLITANSTANLFLINPNGIVFGQNARLDIGGSFLASTASSLKFADGFEFSAINPQSVPLLSINVPVGLQYGANPGNILNQSQAFDSSGEIVGFQVKPEKTLALVGGDVVIEGGFLVAPSGRIELGSVAGNSFVSLKPNDTGYTLGYKGIENFKDIHLTQEAFVATDGDSGGSIQVQGANVILADGSQISAVTLGEGTGKGLTVNATQSLQLIGTSADGLYSSGLFSSTYGTGAMGNLTINTRDLLIRDGAVVRAGTFAAGKGGDLTVTADSVQLIGTSADGLYPSGLFASTYGTGADGNLTINTRDLLIQDGAQIDAGTFGGGEGGDLTVTADSVQLIGTSTDGLYPSALFTSSDNGTTGDAGNLTIDTRDLLIRDGAQVSAGTSGEGKGGNLSVTAESLQLIGTSVDGRASSGLLTISDRATTGDAGDLTINTRDLLIRDGAQASASTFGRGKGGNLTVTADSVQLIGTSTNGRVSSGLFASSVRGATGDAGNLTINTRNLLVRDGAQASASTFGAGKGGSLSLTADFVELIGISTNGQRPSGLFASSEPSATGDAGNLMINTRNLLVQDGAQVSASTFGAGKGGSLSLTANFVELIGTALNGRASSGLFALSARGTTGDAGNLTINTRNLLVRDGAVVSTGTFGKGKGGNLSLTADSIQLIDSGANGQAATGLFTATNDTGAAGDLMINTRDLLVRDGAVVSTDTFGAGKGGNLSLTADFVELIGISANGRASSGLFASAVGTGKAGDLSITTQQLLISNGAVATVSSRGEGTTAGNIVITANSVRLDNGQITAQTLSGNGGNLNFNIADLLMRHGSKISTTAGTAQSGGNGGNMKIDSRYIIAIPEENSDITANAFTGTGGKVEINSQGIFGIESRTKPTEKSDITASSELGVSGVINIKAPDTSSIQNSFTELPPVIDTNALIANSCISRGTKRQENSFTITGSGALTPNRPGVLVSNYTTGEVRGVETTSHPWKKGDPIIEPTGLYRLNNGQLLLSRECSN
jgi:filamentous hemagglutinin family protein